MNKERLSKLIQHMETNADDIKPTFNMLYYNTCCIFQLPKAFPEDWEYIDVDFHGNIRAVPKGMTVATYCPFEIMDKALEYLGIDTDGDFLAKNHNFEEQIDYMKRALLVQRVKDGLDSWA